MKKIGYQLVKIWIRVSLHLYFGKIKIYGLENVPRNRAVLFLPNHQSALLDVLLIAVDCNRKPYFLTRSDVFKGRLLQAVFAFLQMIPIYRIRDGREALKNNHEVFDRCTQLLTDKEALLMFPEANHSLKRRVRPLSKGFTRIIFGAFEANEELDVHLVPIGMNYQNATSFPDQVALNFGKSISARPFYDPKNIRSSEKNIKSQVVNELETLTTHIADEKRYDAILDTLNMMNVDYLEPEAVNRQIEQIKDNPCSANTKKDGGFLRKTVTVLFMLVNLPMVLIWKKVLKPKVWEPEFIGTLRFAFALIGYPMYYAILFATITFFLTIQVALLTVVGLFLFNWGYVKWI